MNLEEYNKIKDYTYEEYCEYLKDKYGKVPYKYGSSKNKKPGLFIHHIGENEIPSLSSSEVKKNSDPKYQEPEMLCYCDYLEHFLLHLMIGRTGKDCIILAMAGLETWIKPALINFFDHGFKNTRVSEEYYNLIQNDKNVFEILLKEHDSLVKDQDLVFDHNAALYLQLEENMATKNKALVVLGTGLGKTTTGLQYLKNHNIRALVLGPNNLIKNGWDQHPEYCDTMTYQAFSNHYNEIDYSKYGCVILDEVHHAGYDEELGKGAKVWGKAINYLVDNNIKILGLTATPDRTDGIMLGQTLFKDAVCKGLSIEEGIRDGILYPFSYITSIYDTSGITEELKDQGYEDDEEYVKLRGQLDLALNNLPTIPTTLLKYMPHNNRKGIIFVQDIEDMGRALKIFREAFSQEEVHVLHSKQSTTEQNESREWFKKTNKGYLMAVNMITEGAHYDGVNTLIMFRRTDSYLLYTQQLGRIITLTIKNNPEAIVFDLVNNINSIKYNDRTSRRYKEPADKELLKILREIKNSKSAQIIIANETQDIVERLEKLKDYTDNHWEEWEDDILRQYYPTEGIKGCQKRLEKDMASKRTLQAIGQRANVLNLRADYHYWSNEEIQKLKEYYEKYGRIKCATFFPHKTPSSVYSKIDALNLATPLSEIHYSPEEIQIIKDNYEIKTIQEMLKLLPKRSSDSITHKARELGLRSSYNLSWTTKQLEDLKNNREVQGRSFEVCKAKCRELKIHHIKYYPQTNHYWTQEEIDILKKYYPVEGGDVYKRLPNRKKTTIATMASKLNIKSQRDVINFMVVKTSRKVKCIETNEVFDSISQANKKYPGASNLKRVIEGKQSSAGTLPDGTKLHWEYVED